MSILLSLQIILQVSKSGSISITISWIRSLLKRGWVIVVVCTFGSPCISSLLSIDSILPICLNFGALGFGHSFHAINSIDVVVSCGWISSLNKSSVFLWTSWARSVASSPLISSLLSIKSSLSSSLSLARLGFH